MRYSKQFQWVVRRYPTNWTLGSFYWWYDKTAYRSTVGELGTRCTRFTLSFGFLCFGLEMDWTWR